MRIRMFRCFGKPRRSTRGCNRYCAGFLPRPAILSEPRIDGLALQGENTKDTFVNTPEWFAFNESLKAFHAQGELTHCERPFCAESARTKALEVLRRCVFGSVDDAQVLTSAAFDGGLDQPTASPRYKRHGFHDHALTTRGCQLLPPRDALRRRRRLLKVDDLVGCGENQLRIGLREAPRHLHVPDMILVR